MDSFPPRLAIEPFRRPVDGVVRLPGSKSITNRALILAALSDRTVLLRGALFSRDTHIMVAGLRALGFAIETDATALTIKVSGEAGAIPVRAADLNVGNAGTVARFLTALVCLRPDGVYRFDGDAAMRRRPIGALLDALATQGAKADGRTFPFTLRTAGLPGGEIPLDASESSQMLSALLLVAPQARSPLTVRPIGAAGSRPFVAMTEAMVRQFRPAPAEYAVEGDASAASYLLALALVTGGRIELPSYGGPLQGDVRFADVLTRAGLRREGPGRFRGGPLSVGSGGLDEDFREFSDTFLTLAALAPLLPEPTRIRGIAHTRRQETDRVAGMARELRRLGQHVVETEDALEIHPRPLVPEVEIETYEDHRFAMSFAVLGCHDLRGDGRPWLTVRDPGCCAKTFPAFFDLLARLRGASH